MTYEHQNFPFYFQTTKIDIETIELFSAFLSSPQSSGRHDCDDHVGPWPRVPRTRVGWSPRTRGCCGCCDGRHVSYPAWSPSRPHSPCWSRVCPTLPPGFYFRFRACDCCCAAGNESFDSRMSFLSLKKFQKFYVIEKEQGGLPNRNLGHDWWSCISCRALNILFHWKQIQIHTFFQKFSKVPQYFKTPKARIKL